MMKRRLIMSKKRNSSFELLRIICMFLIIAYHYAGHGGYGTFSLNNLSASVVYIQILSLFGRLSCSIFAMITGFYMVDRVDNKHYRKIIPIAAQLIFYSVLILAVVYVYDSSLIGLKEIIKSLFSVIWGNWYVVNYMIFFLLIPAINQMVNNLSRKNFTILVVVLIFVWSIIPTFTKAWASSGVDFFIVTYLLGAYIKRCVYGKVNYKNIWNLILGLFFGALLILSTLVIDLVAKCFNSELIFSYATYFKEYKTVIALPCAVFIFMFFSRISFESNIINYISKSTLGIYLIHENFLLRVIIWERIFPNVEYVNNPYLHSVVKIIAVFVVCLIVDIIRRETIEKVFLKWFNKNCDGWVEKIKSIPEKIRKRGTQAT